MEHEPLLQRKFLSPRYWPAWTGIGLLCVLAWLPYRLRLNAGRLIGLTGYYLARKRRYIAEVTIRHCFPDLDSSSHQQMVRNCFMENGIGVAESAAVWVRGAAPLGQRHQFTGAEAAVTALHQGRGVLILVPHYSSMDYIAAMLSLHLPYLITYRPNNNTLFDAFIQRGRHRYCATTDRNNTRAVVRELKQGGAVWYAPDQDFARPDLTVFAPFFGHPAATLTAAAKLAAMTRAAVFCLNHHRDDESCRHELALVAVEPSWPTGDELADATTMNQYFENAIRHSPSQYMWMHKRFKTQPGGKPDSPYIHSDTFCKTITPELYSILVKGSALESGHEAYLRNGKAPLLANGLYMRLFEGIPGPVGRRHPSLQFDRLTKDIRSRGINSVTPDNIFKVSHLNFTGVTCHPLAGTRLNKLTADSIKNCTLERVASFLADAHKAGVLVGRKALATLYVSESGCSISEPLDVRLLPFSLSCADRTDNLAVLVRALDLAPEQQQELVDRYTAFSGLAASRLYIQELARALPHCASLPS